MIKRDDLAQTVGNRDGTGLNRDIVWVNRDSVVVNLVKESGHTGLHRDDTVIEPGPRSGLHQVTP